MDSFRVEYLIPIAQDSPFCNNLSSFRKILESINNVSISNKVIKFNDISIDYELQVIESTENNHIYFHIKMTINNIDKINDFEVILRSIKSIFNNIKPPHSQVQTLWDDLGLYYSNQAYKEIYIIENLMRKLITKFMLVNVGHSWKDSFVPKEVDESIKSKSPTNSYSYLFDIDFIQISNFLFKEYTSVKTDEFINKIKHINEISEINLSDLMNIIPKSNWDRYFKEVVECDREYLSKRWNNLYELRNMVAHNKIINKHDLERILRLTKEIEPFIQSAIDKLDEIKIPTLEKDDINENILINTNALLGEFLRKYNTLTSIMHNVIKNYGYEDKKTILRTKYSIRGMLMTNNEVLNNISPDIRGLLDEIIFFRNILVHESNIEYYDSEIKLKIDAVEVCIQYFISEIVFMPKQNITDEKISD